MPIFRIEKKNQENKNIERRSKMRKNARVAILTNSERTCLGRLLIKMKLHTPHVNVTSHGSTSYWPQKMS